MPDLIYYIPNHGYSIGDTIYESNLDANFFVRDPDNDPAIDTNSFVLSTTDDDLNIVQFTTTITDGFVREVDTSLGTTTISGLEHLEGETVKVTSGGAVVATEVVSSGSITLSSDVFIYAAGKGYNATLIPMDMDIEGTGLTTTKRPNRVIVNLFETLGGKIGQDVNTLVNIPDVDTLTTDFREVSLPGGYTRDTDVVVRQSDPLPITVLSLSYDLGASRD
jgi:hypothetical protein